MLVAIHIDWTMTHLQTSMESSKLLLIQLSLYVLALASRGPDEEVEVEIDTPSKPQSLKSALCSRGPDEED